MNGLTRFPLSLSTDDSDDESIKLSSNTDCNYKFQTSYENIAKMAKELTTMINNSKESNNSRQVMNEYIRRIVHSSESMIAEYRAAKKETPLAEKIDILTTQVAKLTKNTETNISATNLITSRINENSYAECASATQELWVLSGPVLKYGPRSLSCARVIGNQ